MLYLRVSDPLTTTKVLLTILEDLANYFYVVAGLVDSLRILFRYVLRSC